MNTKKIVKEAKLSELDKKRFIKKITKMHYKVNRMTLAVRLGLEGLPECFTKEERWEQINEGKIPKDWDFHHILPQSRGGTHSIDNLALIDMDNHCNLHMNLIRFEGQAGELSKDDLPLLRQCSAMHKGYSLDMCND